MLVSFHKYRAVDVSTTNGMVGREDLRGEGLGFWAQVREPAFSPFCVRAGNWGPTLTRSVGQGCLVFFSSLFSLKILLLIPFSSLVIQKILILDPPPLQFAPYVCLSLLLSPTLRVALCPVPGRPLQGDLDLVVSFFLSPFPFTSPFLPSLSEI